MKARECTKEDLFKALDKINEKYGGNVEFNRFDDKGFTLRVKSSKGPGHRLSQSSPQKRMVSACWHVHGDFFDALFEVNPDAYVISLGDKRISKDRGNWADWNIGSRMFPMYFSEACECNE